MRQPSAVNETSPSKESYVHAGPDFIDSQPCLIATAAQGVAIQVAAIDILPQLISVTPEGLANPQLFLFRVQCLLRDLQLSRARNTFLCTNG